MSTRPGTEFGKPISNVDAKREIAATVASRAVAGEVIGAGSGSTAYLTVLALGALPIADTLAIVPTSLEIELAAHAVGLTVRRMPGAPMDWCFDGADEIDADQRMIKGRGGALHRERQVFATARRRLIVADSSKDVSRLGENFRVPVEVDPDAVLIAFEALDAMPNVTDVAMRMATAKDGPVITEGAKIILDVQVSSLDVAESAALLAVPGVCCTGVFEGFAFERIL